VLGLKQKDKNRTEAEQMNSLGKLMGVSRREIIMGDEIRKKLGAANMVEEIYSRDVQQSLLLASEQ
jgi:hypothetical protein